MTSGIPLVSCRRHSVLCPSWYQRLSLLLYARYTHVDVDERTVMVVESQGTRYNYKV